MKHLKVAEARAQFGDLLDRAEAGLPVVIERRGIRFRIVVEDDRAPRPAKRLFEHVDESILEGGWTWSPGRGGLRLVAPKRK
ncbi:MAG TPA: type II toxin-antitoxin system prevent-host-death family antitoxin [Vicinamibacterales bacterium]|nr:type II toxin-antitoxin system prevent-host-death family antitoxin [Vicinamibacterales bacterium]